MISKSFELSIVKKTKGKITVSFDEIAKISPIVKEETNNLLSSMLEVKLVDSVENSNKSVESLTGGANE